MGLFNKYFHEAKKTKDFSAFVSARFNTFSKNLKLKGIYQELIDYSMILGGDSYLSDALFVWGRELGWIRDKKFLDSCRKTKPSLKDGGVDSSISWRTHTACWAASHACKTKGDFFEFGCYAGYTACMIRNFVDDKYKKENDLRKFFWFDMFTDKKGGKDKTTPLDQSESENSAIERSKLFDNAFVIKGDVSETYVRNNFFSQRKIGFAHFDLNDHLVEMSVIKKAVKNTERGTVFLFDDFAMCPFHNQNTEYRKFFRDIGHEILELPTGQGLIIF